MRIGAIRCGQQLFLRNDDVRRMRTACPPGADQPEYALPRRKAPCASADSLDHARDIVAQHERKAPRALEPQQAPPIALRALGVDRVDRGGLHAHQDFGGAGARPLDGAHQQVRRRGRLGADQLTPHTVLSEGT